jgi:hypothetical protein
MLVGLAALIVVYGQTSQTVLAIIGGVIAIGAGIIVLAIKTDKWTPVDGAAIRSEPAVRTLTLSLVLVGRANDALDDRTALTIGTIFQNEVRQELPQGVVRALAKHLDKGKTDPYEQLEADAPIIDKSERITIAAACRRLIIERTPGRQTQVADRVAQILGVSIDEANQSARLR